MRRWLLLVMVLLLPLRGWVGDAMAGQMLQQQAAAVVTAHAVHAQGHTTDHAHDCDHHPHAAPAGHDDTHANGPQPDCSTCASCQVCSSVALSPAMETAPTGFSHPQPQATPTRYASAEPTLAYKPPRL